MTLCFQHASFLRDNLAADELLGVRTETNTWIGGGTLEIPFIEQRGETPEVIFNNIKKHMPSWAEAVHDPLDQLEIKKLNGLSNSCYKVALDKRVKLSDPDAPRAVLYRKIENEVVDKDIEHTIFKTMSDSGQGPKMIAHQDDYRIEGFIESRVLSIWEMRNPVFMDNFV